MLGSCARRGRGGVAVNLRRSADGRDRGAGGRGGAAGGVRAGAAGPARPGRRADRAGWVAARVRRRRQRRRLRPAAGAGGAAPGGLDRQGDDGPGPVPRARGRPARPGRPGPPLPALAAPGHPVRADHGPAPAGPHRWDRRRHGRLAVADRGGAGPRPHPAGLAARRAGQLLERRLRRARAGAGAGRRLLVRRGAPAPRARPVRHDRLGGRDHRRGPGPGGHRAPRAGRRGPGPGPLGADHGRVGGDPVHRRRPGPPPPGGGRRRPAPAGAGDPRGHAGPGPPHPRGEGLRLRPRGRDRPRRRLHPGRPPGRRPRLLRRRLRLPGDRGRGGRPRQRPLAVPVQQRQHLGGRRPRHRPAAGGRPRPGAAPRPAARRPRPAGRRGAGPAPYAADLPAELAPLAGTYAAFNPWMPQVRIVPDRRRHPGPGVARRRHHAPDPPPRGRLPARQRPDSPERAAFEAEVEGRPMRVVVSGWPFDRVD